MWKLPTIPWRELTPPSSNESPQPGTYERGPGGRYERPVLYSPQASRFPLGCSIKGTKSCTARKDQRWDSG